MGYLQTYRDTVLSMLPRWLSGYLGSRINYTFGTAIDALGESLVSGLFYKYPVKNSDQLYDSLQLSLIGQAHGIVRGLSESDDQYANRLKYWRQVRKRKGNPFPMLEQIQALLAPYPVTARVITNTGARYTLAPGGYVYAQKYTSKKYADFSTVPGGTITIDSQTWNWDGKTIPSRYWVVLCDTSGTLFQRDGYWSGAGYWGDGLISEAGWNTSNGTKSTAILDPLSRNFNGTYGSTLSIDTVQTIMSLIKEWTPPHAYLENVILAFNQTQFDNITPGGNWDNAGNRSLNYVYWTP